MVEYNFERFTVLVVEDNPYMKSLLYATLKALGVGNVRAASDGAEAIDILKLIKTNPGRAGMMSVDIVLSNWMMEPVDGLRLLRWVRMSKDSPDRFLPFIMLTGYADIKRVGVARAAGCTEFMAKPFSAQALIDRFVAVIEHPRPFLRSKEFFGPDRRRRDVGPPGTADRRQASKQDTEVVHE